MTDMSPEEISRMIARGVADEVTRTTTCEVHGQKPTITVAQAEPTGLEYAIAGCCHPLRKKARKAIDDLLGSGPTDINDPSAAPTPLSSEP